MSPYGSLKLAQEIPIQGREFTCIPARIYFLIASTIVYVM